jgi:glyoxylase-like metal-dependent hydrolase (beta-lactamase superfamily II)
MRHLRPIVTLSLAAAALSTIPFAAGQQPTGDPFSTEIRKVKDGLYVIPGYDGAVTGGNVAVRVTNEGTIIVDDRLPPSSAEIAGKVRSVTSQPIIKVAEIVAHRNNRANMIRSKLAAPPRLVFTDQAAVFLGNVEAQAIHLGRGHTNGDAVIYFPDLRTIHTGDLVVWGKRTDGSTLTPFVDRASGGSLVEWVTTLDGVLKLDFDTAIPGHGPVLTKDNIRTFRQNLVTLRQRVTEVVRSGAKKEDLGAKLKTDDLGWPFPPERLNELWDEFGAGR